MASCDLFDLLERVDAAPGVVEARREYSRSLKALRAVLPAPVFDALWQLVLDVDAAAGAVVVEAATAGYTAAGGELREVL